ncbi:unnamed protein product [Prunus brigantina]
MKKTYIIQMDKSKMPASFADDHFQWLTAEEAELLEKQSGILSVMPELRYELHTTRTPQFLGMLGGINEAVFPALEKLSKVIIGVLDTGVWPEIKSYDDKGLGPVPISWRGQCEEGKLQLLKLQPKTHWCEPDLQFQELAYLVTLQGQQGGLLHKLEWPHIRLADRSMRISTPTLLLLEPSLLWTRESLYRLGK